MRIPVFALSMLASVSTFAAASIAFIAMPFYLQDVTGRSEVATGLLMTPWPAAVAVIAPIAGRLTDRFSPAALGGLDLPRYATASSSSRCFRRKPEQRISSGALRCAGSASACSNLRTTKSS